MHCIKIREQYADAVDEGRKNFEVRLNDRGYNAGDTVGFIVYDEYGVPYISHPIDDKTFRITYIHSGLGVEKDYVVFGIREIKKGK